VSPATRPVHGSPHAPAPSSAAAANDRPAHDPTGRLLIALDVDGTLTAYDDTVSPASRRAVKAAQADGIEIVIATGRSVHATLVAAQALDFDSGWAVCSNGAITVRLDPALDGGFELVELVQFQPAEAVGRICAAVPGAIVAVEDIGKGFFVSAPWPRQELHGNLTICPLARLLDRPVPRAVVRSVDMDRAEMLERVGPLELEAVAYDVGWSAWMDITAAGVSKAAALESLRGRLGIAASGTVAVGDGTNDMSMLRWASRGVSMGGASPEVVAAGTDQARSQADDGVAHLLETILAARRPA
jgi:hydroxymethylpyrimidine pyrophosphatase-like HAD family hydrolase